MRPADNGIRNNPPAKPVEASPAPKPLRAVPTFGGKDTYVSGIEKLSGFHLLKPPSNQQELETRAQKALDFFLEHTAQQTGLPKAFLEKFKPPILWEKPPSALGGYQNGTYKIFMDPQAILKERCSIEELVFHEYQHWLDSFLLTTCVEEAEIKATLSQHLIQDAKRSGAEILYQLADEQQARKLAKIPNFSSEQLSDIQKMLTALFDGFHYHQGSPLPGTSEDLPNSLPEKVKAFLKKHPTFMEQYGKNSKVSETALTDFLTASLNRLFLAKWFMRVPHEAWPTGLEEAIKTLQPQTLKSIASQSIIESFLAKEWELVGKDFRHLLEPDQSRIYYVLSYREIGARKAAAELRSNLIQNTLSTFKPTSWTERKTRYHLENLQHSLQAEVEANKLFKQWTDIACKLDRSLWKNHPELMALQKQAKAFVLKAKMTVAMPEIFLPGLKEKCLHFFQQIPRKLGQWFRLFLR